MSLEWHALQVRTPSPGPAPWHAPQRSECRSSVQPWLSWLHASAPKAAAGVASGTPRFFDGLRKQILVQLAASSLLHFLLQSEPSRQELRNRLQFPPAKLNLQRNTNPPILHATARDPASRRWRLYLQDLTLGDRWLRYETGGLPGGQHQQAGSLRHDRCRKPGDRSPANHPTSRSCQRHRRWSGRRRR